MNKVPLICQPRANVKNASLSRISGLNYFILVRQTLVIPLVKRSGVLTSEQALYHHIVPVDIGISGGPLRAVWSTDFSKICAKYFYSLMNSILRQITNVM